MGTPTLCLTGTIVPFTDKVERKDTDLRLADYVAALDFYLQHTDLPVHFVENSEYDLHGNPDFDRFADHPRFSLHRLPPHPDKSKGKGFQEFFLLDQWLESACAGNRMIKVTGRYRVTNILELLRGAKAGLNMDLHRRLGVALTGFFCVDTALYEQHLKGCYREADDSRGRYIEHVLYDKITNESELMKRTALLPKNPRYEGVSGSYGGSLGRHPTKMKVRGLERTISRRLGINRFLMEY